MKYKIHLGKIDDSLEAVCKKVSKYRIATVDMKFVHMVNCKDCKKLLNK